MKRFETKYIMFGGLQNHYFQCNSQAVFNVFILLRGEFLISDISTKPFPDVEMKNYIVV